MKSIRPWLILLQVDDSKANAASEDKDTTWTLHIGDTAEKGCFGQDESLLETLGT